MRTLALLLVAACASAQAAEPPPAAERVRRAQAVLDAELSALAFDERGEALAALGASGRFDALSRLAEALKAEKGETRFAAARGLAYLREPKAGPAIAKAFRDEKGWAVRKELAHAAGACSVAELAPDLKKALVDPNQELVIAAAWALKDLGDPAGAASLARFGNPERKGAPKEGADRWSRKVLAGQKEGDKVLAARTLAEMGTADDVKLLEPLLVAPDAGLRTWAAAAILKLAGKAP